MMELKIENASVIYVPDHGYVKLKCREFLSYQQVVDVTVYAFDMVQRYNLRKCIVDLQESKNYPHGAEEYLRDIWYPRMAAAGVSRIAFVVPKNLFGRASMLVVHAGVAMLKIDRKYFSDEESAVEWLNT